MDAFLHFFLLSFFFGLLSAFGIFTFCRFHFLQVSFCCTFLDQIPYVGGGQWNGGISGQYGYGF